MQKSNYKTLKSRYWTCLVGLSGALFLLGACKREDVKSIGPALYIATDGFKVTKAFGASNEYVSFNTDSVWFDAKFNEEVSWEITIKGEVSKAVMKITGHSDSLLKQNALWTGEHSEKYFFKAGETAIAELYIFGVKQTWKDTITILTEKANYGSNVVVWSDMDGHGATTSWYDYFDNNEKIFSGVQKTIDPIQGLYRSVEGKDGLGKDNYYIGALTHTFLTDTVGFDTSLDNIYVNFYMRKRTNTSAVGMSLLSIAGKDTARLNYDIGKLDWDDWKLVSIKLSAMKVDPANKTVFKPKYVSQMAFYLGIHTTAGQDQTGFDIDFITFTRNKPFGLVNK
jgi:hypothetical protein